MSHTTISHPFRLLLQIALVALVVLMARQAGALDDGHLAKVKPAEAENLFDAFIAPVYHLADEAGQDVVIAFDNPLPDFKKPIRFAIVMYLDRQAAEAEALAASERDGRKYVLKVTTLARVLKALYQTKDHSPSDDYRRPDLLVVEDRTMQPVQAEYFVNESNDQPYTVTLGKFSYLPVFICEREAAAYETGLEKHTGKSYRRVSLGMDELLAWMAKHSRSTAQARVFGYGGPDLVRDFHRSVHQRLSARAEGKDKERSRVIRGSDPTGERVIRK